MNVVPPLSPFTPYSSEVSSHALASAMGDGAPSLGMLTIFGDDVGSEDINAAVTRPPISARGPTGHLSLAAATAEQQQRRPSRLAAARAHLPRVTLPDQKAGDDGASEASSSSESRERARKRAKRSFAAAAAPVAAAPGSAASASAASRRDRERVKVEPPAPPRSARRAAVAAAAAAAAALSASNINNSTTTTTSSTFPSAAVAAAAAAALIPAGAPLTIVKTKKGKEIIEGVLLPPRPMPVKKHRASRGPPPGTIVNGVPVAPKSLPPRLVLLPDGHIIKKRKRFTPEQEAYLVEQFERNSTPNSEQLQTMANWLNDPLISRDTVKIYFQNRRQKQKKVELGIIVPKNKKKNLPHIDLDRLGPARGIPAPRSARGKQPQPQQQQEQPKQKGGKKPAPKQPPASNKRKRKAEEEEEEEEEENEDEDEDEDEEDEDGDEEEDD
jgi:hypothetical protein